MEKQIKKELFNSMDTTREVLKNNLEIVIETYVEMLARLDIMTYLLVSEDKKSS